MELVNGSHGIGTQGRGVELGVVEDHLVGVCGRTLRFGVAVEAGGPARKIVRLAPRGPAASTFLTRGKWAVRGLQSSESPWRTGEQRFAAVAFGKRA